MANSFGWDSSVPGSTSIVPGVKGKSNVVVVADVITNEEHNNYNIDGSNVGIIYYKSLELQGMIDGASAQTSAAPIDPSIKEYPLIGEVVDIHKTSYGSFYSKRLNITKKLQFSALKNTLSDTMPALPRQNAVDRMNMATDPEGGRMYNEGEEREQLYENENYQPRESLHNLKHFDGDVVFQNRYGATLRFGSSQLESALNQETVPGPAEGRRILGPTKSQANDPIIIMRVGERETPTLTVTPSSHTPNEDYGLVIEDINRDDSSFVLSSNQLINFHFSTSGNSTYFRSADRLDKDFIPFGEADPNDGLTKTPLSGKLSLLNSDTLVLNSKENNIILSANQDVISLSNRDTIFDAGEDFIIGAKQIYLMAEESSEPLPTIPSRMKTEVTGTVAIAEQVIEMFKEVLNLLLPFEGGSPYKAIGGKVVNGGQAQRFIIEEKLGRIKSNLVRIQK